MVLKRVDVCICFLLLLAVWLVVAIHINKAVERLAEDNPFKNNRNLMRSKEVYEIEYNNVSRGSYLSRGLENSLERLSIWVSGGMPRSRVYLEPKTYRRINENMQTFKR